MARFCKHCGAQLSDNAKFCKGCGQAVAAPASNNTQTVYQTPVQNVQMSVNSVCQNCGNQLRPGAKFCRVCGMASLSNDFAGHNTQKKKRSKMFYPIVAVVTALAIAIVSVGGYYLYDRVISLHIGNDGFTQSYEYRKFKDMSYPKGNSKAFSITPVDGITISAKKDALKEDTDITFTPIEDERVYEEYTPVLESMGSTPLAAFDFDMGLEPEECIPGYVDMSFDLAALGVPENLWEDIDVYRQREEFDTNEPAGAFEKYAADLDKDGKLTMSTTQNCSIWLTLTAGFIKIKGLLAAAATTPLSGPVIAGAIIVVSTLAIGGIAWYKNDQQHGHFNKDSTIKIEIRDKWTYDIMVDLKDTEAADKYIGKNVQNSVKKLNEYSVELRKKAEKEYEKEVNKRASAGGQKDKWFGFIDTWSRANEIRKIFNKEEYIKAYFEKDKKFEELSKALEIPKSVQTTIAVINDAYDYMGAHKIKHKGRVVEFDICPPDYMKELGAKVSARTWPSYMNLNIKALVKGKQYDESGVDGFRLTCTHEYFHICQEEYVWITKTKETFEDTRLEEATAAVLEKDASIYFYSKGIQKTNPDPAISGSALSYVKRDQTYCYGIPLNELPDPADNAGLKNKIKNIFTGREKDPWVDIGYTEADLIDFLRKKKGYVSIAAIMNSYTYTFPHTSFVDVLRSKRAFNIETDTEWNKLYHEFIMGQASGMALQNSIGIPIFPNYIEQARFEMPEDGSVITVKVSNDNTSGVRVIIPYMVSKTKTEQIRKEYLAIVENDTKDDGVQVKLLNGTYTDKYKGRNYTDIIDAATVLLYSVGEKGAKANNVVTIKTILITAPEAPMFTVRGDSLSVSTKDAPDALKKEGKVTTLRTVITYKGKTITDDTLVGADVPEKKLGNDIDIDISGLGNIGSKEDIALKQAWVYVDKDKKEYVGPQIDGILVDDDISGTWDLDVEVNYNSQVLEQFVNGYMNAVDLYGQMYGQDSIADVTDIGKMYRDGTNAKSKTTMILKPKQGNAYEALFKYPNGAPDETYDGTYDPITMKLALKPRKKTATGSDGITYDYKEFGLQSDINIQIKREKEKSGKIKFTLTGESANDPNNPIVAYTVKLSGVRISDKYE